MQSTTTPARSGKPEAETAEESACQVFDTAFAQSGTNRASTMAAFESLLQDLSRSSDREEQVRDIAKAAALSTARSHGNIIETGRTLLGSIDELGAKFSLDVRRCKDQVMLGLAEGACQIGPIVYGRFLDIASEYRDNADDWIAKNKRRIMVFQPDSLPVIVPFEAELTLTARPFKESPVETAPVQPRLEKQTALETPAGEPEAEEQDKNEKPQETNKSAPAEWSRPKGKGFFQRLSDVMGNFFGR